MYDAHRHGVLIAGQSRPGDSTRTAIDTKQNGGQYSGQSLRQIATQVFQQLGINVKFAGNSQALDSTIDDAQVQPTESHFHFVERLARGRAWIGDDVQGNLVLYGGLDGGGSGPALVEGENIQWARVTINDLSIIKEGEVYAQGPCTDKNWGASCTEPSVPFNMNFPRTKPYKLLLERGASNSKIMEELKYRARYEIAWRLGTQIRAEIGVYGWFAPNGGLWQPLPINEQTVNVYSPMAMLNTPLAIQALTFSQDNEAGTMTTLELVDPGHFYGNKEAWK
jgi:prophage tail gpP-like protein